MSRYKSLSQHSMRSHCLSDEELVKQVNDLKHKIRLLTIENEIIEKAITKLDPSLLVGIQQTLDYAIKLHNQCSSGSSSIQLLGSFSKSTSRYFDALSTITSPSRMFTSPSKMFTSPSRMFVSPSRMFASPSRISTRKVESSGRLTSIQESGPKVNILERSELVSLEMENIAKKLAKVSKNAEKQHALLKAQLEEITVRVADTQKAVEMFENEVKIEGWDKIAQRIPAEVWVRFMAEWVKTTDSVIGKFRLRTSTLNSQFIKLKNQINVKSEIRESLRPVDFEQMKIENGERVKTINRKIQQLTELKKMTGEANLNLTVHKEALLEQNNYLTKVRKSTKSKEEETFRLDKERDVIQNQIENLVTKLEEIKKVRLAYQVPDVMDYVNVKAEVTDLQHSIKVLENRIHIHQIALDSINKKLRNMILEETQQRDFI